MRGREPRPPFHRSWRMKRRRAALVVVAVFLVVAGLVGYRLLAPPTRFAAGSPIQLDDFTFAVTGASPAGTSGGAELYAVKLLVSNHALRVDYTFKPEEVEVTADRAHPLQYVSSSNWGPSTLKAGENRLFVLLFKGNPGARPCRFASRSAAGWELPRIDLLRQ